MKIMGHLMQNFCSTVETYLADIDDQSQNQARVQSQDTNIAGYNGSSIKINTIIFAISRFPVGLFNVEMTVSNVPYKMELNGTHSIVEMRRGYLICSTFTNFETAVSKNSQTKILRRPSQNKLNIFRSTLSRDILKQILRRPSQIL